jgi:hypothetical protein
VLFARYFSVFGSGIETLMAQVFLEKPQAVSRIIKLYRIDRERVPQPMRGYIMYPAGLGSYQLWQPCFVSTFFDDLPRPVAVNAKD